MLKVSQRENLFSRRLFFCSSANLITVIRLKAAQYNHHTREICLTRLSVTGVVENAIGCQSFPYRSHQTGL